MKDKQNLLSLASKKLNKEPLQVIFMVLRFVSTSSKSDREIACEAIGVHQDWDDNRHLPSQVYDGLLDCLAGKIELPALPKLMERRKACTQNVSPFFK